MRNPDFTRDVAEVLNDYRMAEMLGLDFDSEILAEHMYDSLIIFAAAMHKVAGTVEE
jgi:hypothetical protein